MPSVSARTIASIPALFVGLVVLVALAAIDLIVALVAAVALAGLTLVLVQRTATNRVLSALNAAQLEEGVEPRLESLVESICASHGINEPGLYVAKTTAMDAAVVGRSGSQGALIAGCVYVLLTVAGMIYSGNVGWADIAGIIVLGGSGIGAGLTEVRLRFSLVI